MNWFKIVESFIPNYKTIFTLVYISHQLLRDFFAFIEYKYCNTKYINIIDIIYAIYNENKLIIILDVFKSNFNHLK